MYEFGIMNIHTNEESTIFGRSIPDAYRRSKLSASDWRVTYSEYID